MEQRIFSDEIKIDKFMLEEECAEHASRYEYWSSQYIDAVSERDVLKRKLDRLKAKLSLEARRDPKILMLPEKAKVTEGAVFEYVITHEDYMVLEENYGATKNKTALLAGVKDAFEHRRSNLSDLVKLWTNAYYSEPHVSAEAKDAIDEKSVDKHREQLKKTLRKRGGE